MFKYTENDLRINCDDTTHQFCRCVSSSTQKREAQPPHTQQQSQEYADVGFHSRIIVRIVASHYIMCHFTGKRSLGGPVTPY